MPAPRVSAIIPVLDEANLLGACLDALARQHALAEVIAVDGGSSDGSLDLLRAAERRSGVPPVRILASGPGRALQMNAGAAAARGTVLLFVHADTVIPGAAAEAIVRAVTRGAVGGAFRHAFIERDPRLAIISAWANARSRLIRIYFGDQAMFVRRDVFERLGGFRPIPIMEDLEFSKRLRGAGPTALLPATARTSGRRFLGEGVGRTAARMIWLRMAWRAGVAPAVLKRRYREVR